MICLYAIVLSNKGFGVSLSFDAKRISKTIPKCVMKTEIIEEKTTNFKSRIFEY